VKPFAFAELAARVPRAVFIVAALLAVLGIATVFGVWPGLYDRPRPAPGAGEAAIPVVASLVGRADVPIYLTGIGTVQAFNSVLVRARIDGQIVKIDFAEGQDVHAGDILVEIDSGPLQAALAQAQAAKLKDQAQLDNARLDLARASRLAASGNGTPQQQDTAHSLVAQLEASLKADEAAIDAAQVQLNYTRIRSPIDGRAGVRALDVGNMVRATDTTGMVTINQIHPIFVSFSLPGDTLPRLRNEMKAHDIEVAVEAGDGRRLAVGKLAVIDNQIDTATATIGYKAVFDNGDDALWPGQFVKIRVLIGTRRDAVTLPATAILRGPEGTYAFVIGADHRVAKRPVKVAWSNKDIAVIDDGLTPDEQVVEDGQYRIQAGTIVEILPQARQPASAAIAGSGQ
jgi:multidrug efflux system membrane fusion protein